MTNTVMIPQLNLFGPPRYRNIPTRDRLDCTITNLSKTHDILISKRQRIDSLYTPIIEQIDKPILTQCIERQQLEIPILRTNINYQYMPAPSTYLDYAQQYLIGNHGNLGNRGNHGNYGHHGNLGNHGQVSSLAETGRFTGRNLSNSRQRQKSYNKKKYVNNKLQMKDYIQRKKLKFGLQDSREKQIKKKLKFELDEKNIINPQKKKQPIIISSARMTDQGTQTLKNSQVKADHYKIYTQQLIKNIANNQNSQNFRIEIEKIIDKWNNINLELEVDEQPSIDIRELLQRKFKQLMTIKQQYCQLARERNMRMDQIVSDNQIY